MPKQQLRSGKSYGDVDIVSSIVAADPVQLSRDVELEPLLQRAYQNELTCPEDDVETFEPSTAPLTLSTSSSAPPSSPSPSSVPPVSPHNPHATQATACKRPLLDDHKSRSLSHRNRKRQKRRDEAYERHGHLGGFNASSALPTAAHLAADLDSKDLPAAHGAYVGVDQLPHGRTVARTPEDMAKRGFRYVEWEGNVAKPILDSKGRVIVVAVKKITNPLYEQDLKTAFQLVEEARQNAAFDPAERRHRRGAFPAAAFGISYGKGQPFPKRLGGKHQAMLAELLGHQCFHNIAASQSALAAFAAWSPRNYSYYFSRMKELQTHLPNLQPNFKRSVFACMTVNFGPQTQTYIHTDSKNTAHGMCAITSGGNYDHKLGGHLILWDLKIILEFPPGCTVLLPSALLLHSNAPVRKGETRYSITQYSAGGIWRWLDDGCRTEEDIMKHHPPEEMAQVRRRKVGRWGWALQMFSTLEELNPVQKPEAL